MNRRVRIFPNELLPQYTISSHQNNTYLYLLTLQFYLLEFILQSTQRSILKTIIYRIVLLEDILITGNNLNVQQLGMT